MVVEFVPRARIWRKMLYLVGWMLSLLFVLALYVISSSSFICDISL